jgi:hypothetical protein
MLPGLGGCLAPGLCELPCVSDVPLDPGASRAQIRAHHWYGVRSSPRSGTLRATPGSPGRQGSARGPIEASPCRPGGSGVGLCLPGRGDDPVCIPHLRGRVAVRGRAPRESRRFTDIRQLLADLQQHVGNDDFAAYPPKQHADGRFSSTSTRSSRSRPRSTPLLPRPVTFPGFGEPRSGAPSRCPG